MATAALRPSTLIPRRRLRLSVQASSTLHCALRGAASSAAPVATPSPSLRRLLAQAQEAADVGQDSSITVSASIRAFRKHSSVSFLSLSDGSLAGSDVLQAVLRRPQLAMLEATGRLSQGAAVCLTGRLQRGKGQTQAMELVVEDGRVVAECDTAKHPLLSSPKGPSASLVRQHAHLRSQLPAVGATLRLRSRLENALFGWFQEQDYTRTSPPVMTSSDCEGAGEVFKVTESKHSEEPASPAYLTVSAQLHLEALLLGLGKVYSYTPTFRAEDSATNRHLREFWMCEAELPVNALGTEAEQLHELMDVTEELIRSAARVALGLSGQVELRGSASRDAAFLHADSGSSLPEIHRYIGVDSERRWKRITYTEAIEILQAQHDQSSPPPSWSRPKWGDSLSSDQEKYLCTDHFAFPLFVTDYPASMKPFYMRVGSPPSASEAATVACFDLLIPGIGELVGGSLREDRMEVLSSRMEELGLTSPQDEGGIEHPLDWYVSSLRQSGMPPHGGFGIGVERLVMWLAGRDSVRECIPFPRVGRRIRY